MTTHVTYTQRLNATVRSSTAEISAVDATRAQILDAALDALGETHGSIFGSTVRDMQTGDYLQPSIFGSTVRDNTTETFTGNFVVRVARD